MKIKEFGINFFKQGLLRGDQTKQLYVEILPTIQFQYFKIEAGGFIDVSRTTYSLRFSWIIWIMDIHFRVIDDHSESYTK
jgi:hypothetical protein